MKKTPRVFMRMFMLRVLMLRMFMLRVLMLRVFMLRIFTLRLFVISILPCTSLHPSSFIPHPSSFILHPSSLILTLSPCHRLRFLNCFFDGADHPKGLLREIVVFAIDDFAEAPNGIFQLYILPFQTRELSRDEEGL
jgi:hypothetical protein